MINFYDEGKQEIGLFTFYRQQAEVQQQLLRQRAERQRRLKLQRDEQKRKMKSPQEKKIKIEKEQKDRNLQFLLKEHELKNQMERKLAKQAFIPSTILTPRPDYNARAKKYIKQLQLNKPNKILNQLKRKNKKQTKPEQMDHNVQQKKNHIIKQVKKWQSVFINKKINQKKEDQQSDEKSFIQPKQFNSIQLLNINHTPTQNMKLRQYSLDLIKKRPAKKPLRSTESSQRLPKIVTETNKMSLPIPINTKQKVYLNYYNPLQILLNNQKFKLRSARYTKKLDDKIIEQSLNFSKLNISESITTLLHRNITKA